MPLSQQAAINSLNSFLQQSLTFPKSSSLADINLNGVEIKFNDIRAELDDNLKENIIEFIYVDENQSLVSKVSEKNVTGTYDETITTILPSPLYFSDVILKKEQPLVIIRKNANDLKAHLYRTKTENDNLVLEYVGEKDLPATLVDKSFSKWNQTNESDINATNDVNIIRIKDTLTLSFAEDATCYLCIDSKNKTIVSVPVNDAKFFQKFVTDNCPENGSLNIEVNENSKIISIYIKENGKETEMKLSKKISASEMLILERVIAAASALQKQIVTKNQDNKSFSAKKINDEHNIPSSSPSVNQGSNQANNNHL